MMKKRLILLTLLMIMLLALGCSRRNEDIGTRVSEEPIEYSPLYGIDAKDVYYLNMVRETSITNLSFCINIMDRTKRDECEFEVFMRIGELECEDQANQGLKDSCYWAEGTKEGPISCEKIIRLTKRDKCYFEIPKHLQYPKNIEESICNQIQNSSLRGDCLERISKPFGERD